MWENCVGNNDITVRENLFLFWNRKARSFRMKTTNGKTLLSGDGLTLLFSQSDILQ